MTGKVRIKTRRAYEEPEKEDGARFLVDRLWPRGRKKESLKLDGWLKDAAPSESLRKRFCHDPAKWDEFKKRYDKELDTHPEAWLPILEAARKGMVTLVYGARDEAHNNALALMEYLKGKAGKKEK